MSVGQPVVVVLMNGLLPIWLYLVILTGKIDRLVGAPMADIYSSISTTKMSSKGQVVIPEQVREQLALEPGSQFVVVGDKDVVILKRIVAPSLSEFDGLIKEARSQAKAAGLKKSDISNAIKRARAKS